MRINPDGTQAKFFDAARFRELREEWLNSGLDTDRLIEICGKFAEFNKPFIAHFEALEKSDISEHQRLSVRFWIHALEAGLFPHWPKDKTPSTDFEHWLFNTAPFPIGDTIPNLEKL